MSLSGTIDLEAARTKLHKLRDSVELRKEALAKYVNHRETPLPADFAEQAVELENDEALVAIEHELDLELRNVLAALRRVADGSYGQCAVCGGDISLPRLEALPEAIACVACAEQAEISD